MSDKLGFKDVEGDWGAESGKKSVPESQEDPWAPYIEKEEPAESEPRLGAESGKKSVPESQEDPWAPYIEKMGDEETNLEPE